METHRFQVLGYDIEVKDALIAEALQTLTEKKRNVVLLSYFMDMSDADIAREMNLVRSTINEHRRRSLELMRKNMEESAAKIENFNHNPLPFRKAFFSPGKNTSTFIRKRKCVSGKM